MHDLEVRRLARVMFARGSSSQEVAARLGLARSTVRAWRDPLPTDGLAARRSCESPGEAHLGSDGVQAYPYLLGLYLGDGTISRAKRSWVLRVFCADAWPGLQDACADAMAAVSAQRPVWRVLLVGCTAMTTSWFHWPCVFPQHGPGRKHLRPIVLEPWQQEIVDEHPQQFLRGLFHSDGCRSLNTVRRPCLDGIRVYRYPRYLLSNESDDILCLAERSLDRIGVPHRRSRPTCLSVARREGVIALDAFIEPKH